MTRTILDDRSEIERIRRQLSAELKRGEIGRVEFDREMDELDREEFHFDCMDCLHSDDY